MTDDRQRYRPTQDEAEAIDRAGIEAAWLALRPLKDARSLASRGVLACLRAIQAAGMAAQAAAHALSATHPECSGIHHDIDETRMVCSALHGLDADDPSALRADSIGGARIATLFQAAKALEAMATVYSAFDADTAILGTYLVDETTQVAETEVLRWEWQRLACSNDEHRPPRFGGAAGDPSAGPLHV